MKKGEFIEKWCPETSNSRMKEVNYKIVYSPEFESDLNALLTETIKDELTKFLDFLLKNGYCDADDSLYESIFSLCLLLWRRNKNDTNLHSHRNNNWANNRPYLLEN